MTERSEGFAGSGRFTWLFTVAFVLAVSCIACAAQKKSSPTVASAPPVPIITPPTADQLDHEIGEMLGAFQLGDIETMHKYYADNATFVSGAYEPPVAGWQNYVALYQREKAAFQGMQLIRRNTYVFTHGDAAWATYEWEFDSTLNGRPFTARGQTTLVFNRVGDRWLIVHNHTSEICPTGEPVGGPPPAPRPTQNPAPNAPPGI